MSPERDASENNPETIALSCTRGYAECAETPSAAEGAGSRRLPTDFEESVVDCRATASPSGVRTEHSAPFASDPVMRVGRLPCSTRFTRDSRTT